MAPHSILHGATPWSVRLALPTALRQSLQPRDCGSFPLAFNVTCAVANRTLVILTNSNCPFQQRRQVFPGYLTSSLAFGTPYRTLHPSHLLPLCYLGKIILLMISTGIPIMTVATMSLPTIATSKLKSLSPMMTRTVTAISNGGIRTILNSLLSICLPPELAGSLSCHDCDYQRD